MFRTLAFILTAGSLLNAGCRADNGIPGNPEAPPATVAPAPQTSPNSARSLRLSETDAAAGTPTRPLIVCFGDSLTAGYGIEEPGRTYPDVLQQMLARDGLNYQVVNAGVSGNTTKDGLARLPRVIARHPALVVLEFGGNDGLRGLPTEQTQANLATMIQQLQQAHIRVALAGITLPPQYGGAYIQRFNAMYPALASKYHTPLLPMLLDKVYNVPGSMQDDGVHPTAQGAQQVAQNVEGLLKPMLSR